MRKINHDRFPLDAPAGTRLRVHLHDGRVLDGILARVDHRTLRLRGTAQGPLVVLYRDAAARVEAA